MVLCLLTLFTPFGLHLAYVIVHECCHGSFFGTRRLNEIIGTIFGALSLTPFKSRQFEHAQHHAFSGSYSEPTVQRGIERFGSPQPRLRAVLRFCWKFWVPVFAANEQIALWKNARAIDIILAAVIWLPTIYWYPWMLIVIYFYLVLIEFVNLPHHLAEDIWETKGAVPRKEQLRAAKSCADIPIISKWFFLNFNRHRAHHLLPALYWADLPAIPDDSKKHSELSWHLDHRSKTFEQAFAKYLPKADVAF